MTPTGKMEICFSSSCVSLGERVVVEIKIECVHRFIYRQGRPWECAKVDTAAMSFSTPNSAKAASST